MIQPSLNDTQQTRPVTTYTYDPNGNVTSVTDPRGYETIYTYDEDNRKITQESVNPDGPGTSLYTWYYYDADSNLQYVVDAAGAISTRPTTFSASAAYTTEYVYDNLDRKIEEIDPAANSVVNGALQYLADNHLHLQSKRQPRLDDRRRWQYDDLRLQPGRPPDAGDRRPGRHDHDGLRRRGQRPVRDRRPGRHDRVSYTTR